jgi:hypothetical protein
MPIKAAVLPSEFRLIPARVGLNAVAALQRRYIQAGTAIFKDPFQNQNKFRGYLYYDEKLFICVSLLNSSI